MKAILHQNELPQHRKHARHPLYSVWNSMIQRCTNPHVAAWGRYGGRGITVCPEWRSFVRFVADMPPRPAGTELDRIDNNMGYSKANCRWVTRIENLRNCRSNVLVNYHGRLMTVTEAAELSGIPKSLLYARAKSKNPDLFRPVEKNRGLHLIGNTRWMERAPRGKKKDASK